MDKRKIMKKAVELARTMIGDWIARMALALKMAWAEVKAVVANEIGAIQFGADETALKIGRNNVTFEYKNKIYTLDVDVKVKAKKKEFDVELVGQRINQGNTTEIKVTEFIPIGKARIEDGFLIMSKETARSLNVNFRILAGIEMYGGQKATIIKKEE